MFSTKSKWIGRNRKNCLWGVNYKTLPAPYLRKTFTLEQVPGNMELLICGLGYYELYINGVRPDSRVLDPMPSNYDKHCLYVRYDITPLLKSGENVIGVILGNGTYNANTDASRALLAASVWRDYPKLRLELKKDSESFLVSDDSWLLSVDGPIVFDSIRNGESYDARRELLGWLFPDFNDSSWEKVGKVDPPGGALIEQYAEPCRIIDTYPMSLSSKKYNVYDCGVNIAGHVRIKVCGEAGARITLEHDERLTSDGDLDPSSNNIYVFTGEYQTDHYTLKGDDKGEVWQPRFTWHGFRYCRVTIEGKAELISIEANAICTDFKKIGNFETSHSVLNQLEKVTVASFVSNFTGLPTDCPQREKHGWTGDAQLACETGLYHFAAQNAYTQWLDSMIDGQRDSGQLPMVAPFSNWSYNGSCGLTWDSALFIIPDEIHRFSGDSRAIKNAYPAMCKYIDYLSYVSDDLIVFWGGGDWCAPDIKKTAPPQVTGTGYFYKNVRLLAEFSALLGKDPSCYEELAEKIKKSFQEKLKGDSGNWGNGTMTENAAALYFGLADNPQSTVARLAETAEKLEYRCEFGILGAKFVARMLAEYGYVNEACRFFTQESFPGYVNILNTGATTLWENWDGTYSQNHIMFGDLSAWFFKYPGGIRPDFRFGLKKLELRPIIPECMEKFSTSWNGVKISYSDGIYSADVPDSIEVVLTLPDGESIKIKNHISRRLK